MKLLTAVGLAGAFAGCAMDEPLGPDLPQPIDVVWGNSIHAGDMFVLVPGTASYDYLGVTIDPLTADVPEVNPRTSVPIADDAIVFEQAIAAAHRAGIPDVELEDGTISFGIWGVGFKAKHTSFTYVSFEGLHVPVHILGGQSLLAIGGVAEQLLKYTVDNATADASDLYAKIQAWLPTHPSITGAPRNIIVASHSWGGAVAEYLAEQRAVIEAAHGPLVDGSGLAGTPFTIGMGVPGFVLGYTYKGPGLRFLADGSSLYEVDRPDDPVHAMHPGNQGGGHQYDITFGDDFRGSYGITTEEMSCESVPGPCVNP